MQQVKDLIRRAAAAPGTVLDHRRDRHRQGARRARDPCAAARAQRSLRGGQLRGADRVAARERALRPRKGRVHRRGAARAPGLIEHADGGTLFLDEIGTMSKALQAKLLRALESGEVRRIGENESRGVDVRFVAATNIDLKAADDAGEFRSDLYYRLDVHHVHMPALRERAVTFRCSSITFVTRYGGRRGVTACAPAAMGAPPAYSYPGNVRQLEHIIQRAVAIARSAELDARTTCPRNCSPSRRPAPPEGHGRRRARKGRARDDRRDARAPRRRDWRRRPRASGQPHDDVAADEKARPRIGPRPSRTCAPPCSTRVTSPHFTSETSPAGRILSLVAK